MTLPTITKVSGLIRERALCVQQIRLAAGRMTTEAQRQIDRRMRRGQPIDQCCKPGDFIVDGKPICRAHAGQLALQALIAQQERGPVCGCSDEIVQRVTVDGGTCGRGGCPHGGDF